MTETKEKLTAPSCPTLLEVEDYFESAGIPVREGDLHYYVDFFRIASELSGHKLDKWELLEAFDFMREMLLGRKPEIVQQVAENARILLMFRIFEQLPQTRGRFGREEKLRLAYCFWRCLYKKTYNPELDSFRPGASTFTSAEEVLALMELEMQTEYRMFAIPNGIRRNEKMPFGYFRDNPIQATSEPAELEYLRKLRTKGGRRISFRREGCRENAFGQLVDRFTITYHAGLLDRKTVLYFFGSSIENSREAPEGFLLGTGDVGNKH